MPRIFIIYRRADGEALVGRVYDRLERRFGRGRIVRDVDFLRGGDRFEEELLRILGECAAVVVFVGRRWDGGERNGRRRIDERDDLYRRELKRAFARRRPVHPVLIERYALPEENELPPVLRRLRGYEAHLLRGSRDFERDVEGLVSSLERTLKRHSRERRCAFLAAAFARVVRALVWPLHDRMLPGALPIGLALIGLVAFWATRPAAEPRVPGPGVPPDEEATAWIPLRPVAEGEVEVVIPKRMASDLNDGLILAGDGGRVAWSFASFGEVNRLGDAGWELDERENGVFHRQVEDVWLAEELGRGWAVGWHGLIAELHDGRWRGVASPTSNSLHAVEFTPDGTRGWAVGIWGTILEFESGVGWRDCALEWLPSLLRFEPWTFRDESSPPKFLPPDLVHLWIAEDGDSGWALGTYGTILRLEKDTWSLLPGHASIPGAHIHAFAMKHDGSAGWACGNHGVVLRCDGSGWQPYPLPRGSGLEEEENFVTLWADDDLRTGWMLGDRGALLVLKDDQWVAADLGLDAQAELGGRIVASNDGGLAWYSDGKTVLRASAGRWEFFEETWEGMDPPLTILGVSARGDRTWASDASGRIFLGMNGAWELSSSHSRIIGRQTQFALHPGSTVGWAFGPADPTRIADGVGEPRRRALDLGVEAGWLSADGTSGWAVGKAGLVLRFSPEGWEVLEPEGAWTDETLQAVDFDSTGETGLAVSEHGLLCRFADGAWSVLDVRAPGGLNAVRVAPSGEHAWAAGEAGRFVTVELTSGEVDVQRIAEDDLTCIWMRADGRAGRVGTADGRILALRADGWTEEPTDLAMAHLRLEDIASSSDGSSGWALGGFHVLQLDGGRWRSVDLSAERGNRKPTYLDRAGRVFTSADAAEARILIQDGTVLDLRRVPIGEFHLGTQDASDLSRLSGRFLLRASRPGSELELRGVRLGSSPGLALPEGCFRLTLEPDAGGLVIELDAAHVAALHAGQEIALELTLSITDGIFPERVILRSDPLTLVGE